MRCLAAALFAFSLAGEGRSHDGHPHEQRHWEKASSDPDRIVLTWTGDPSTSQAVTWRTDDTVSVGYAELAPADPAARFDLAAERYEAVTEALDLGQYARNAPKRVHFHTVEFEGLEPDALYAYRVAGGDDRWSEWIQFRTAPADPGPVEFIYFGDAQNSVLSHWSRVIRAAYQKAPNANFAIHAGDLVNRAHRDREWAEWFKAGGWIHASLQSIVAAGNHEYDPLGEATGPGGESTRPEKLLSLQWRPQFALPVHEELPSALHETAYYIDYRDVRVVVLDSNREVEPQAKWLDRVLADNPRSWTILTFHHPIFSSGQGRDSPDRRAAWKPVIDKYQVDLVLQGHDHTYARGHAPARMTDGESEGGQVASVFVNSVSGPKMYEFRENGWDVYRPEGARLRRKAENTQFFQVVRIEGRRLTYRAFMADGELYDAFKLIKGEDGAKTLIGRESELGAERRFENTLPYDREGL